MSSDLAARRLRKEYMALLKNPVENIVALPLESNILEWHYVIAGTKDSPYSGGHYHGKLVFPPEYPLKPPSVIMLTPNGRFRTKTRLCLSMSDFHPETWNPMWSVSSILTGLYSFMLESSPTLGSVESTDAQKRKWATMSLESNCRDQVFRKYFPELVTLHEKLQKEKAVTAGYEHQSSSCQRLPASNSNRGIPGIKWAEINMLFVAGLVIVAVAALFLIVKL